MEIRPPNKPNYPAIAEMLGRAMERPISADLLAGQVMADQHFDPNLVWLARESGELLGYLATVLENENAWIKLVAVEPKARNHGLAREMIERAEARLFGEGARVMRAGFGPGPLFYPGVPEGGASEFFKALGYDQSPGGLLATIQADAKASGVPEANAAKSLIEALAPGWWSEIEERLTYKAPWLAMSSDQKALCLADPGQGIGPLFFSEEASAEEAVRGALAIAGTGRRLMDFRDSRWWLNRFALTDLVCCNEFKKDLRGVLHA